MAEVTVLDREMYSEAEAARLLGVSQSTLHYWLEGGVFRGRTYDPVIRREPTGQRVVTWAEFVEAGLLRQYRQDKRIPMSELRQFISKLREELGVPYPLATKRPWVAGQRLVIEAQQEAGLPAEYWLYAPVSDQALLPLGPAAAFLDHVEFDEDVVARWRPQPRTSSPVVIDPALRFGRPSVHGISTEVLWENSKAGYLDDEVADMFGLSVRDVEWALSYEYSAHAA